MPIYIQNSSTSLTLDVQFQTNPPPLQAINKQLKENIIQGWLLYVIKSLIQVGFRFQLQLINLVWISFDSFSFSWSLTICFFVVLYFSVYSCPKMSRSFFYSKLLTFLVFILQSTWFIFKTWRTIEQQPHRACKRTKSEQKQNQVMSHSNWPRALLFDLDHKQCNGVIKWCLHCLTSESKGRFLVNNILKLTSHICCIICDQRIYQKAFINWLCQYLLSSINSFC